MSPEPLPPSPHGSESNHHSPSEVEFEQALSEAERTLQTLKERYTQIKRARRRQAQLQRRRELIKKELRSNSKHTQLQAELKQIKEQLETIELNLESHLFSWGSLKEPFWQAVRFGGLGVLIGWLLKSCT
ncbi:MAG: DUF2203 domain-containing protein [Symploca sp. SIO1C4]|uniref:DUF2203 domain-containing protein n=1 Tax=Symploca sp. SIO1C4 TaxID=2607765 RepID=A0A6B3NFN1_9CYAN|nr:DUF2203 domain-containing protein [Symploca sp. SIO1C4]